MIDKETVCKIVTVLLVLTSILSILPELGGEINATIDAGCTGIWLSCLGQGRRGGKYVRITG